MTTKDAKPKRPRASKSTVAAKKPQVAAPGDATTPAVPDEPPAADGLVGAPPEAAAPTAVGSADAAPASAVLAEEAAAEDPLEATVLASVRDVAVADLTRLVVFRMDGQRYALPIEAVQEIQQLVAISEMPGSSGAVLGVINLRGVVIPAIDMRLLVGLSFREPGLDTPMVLTYTSQGLVALIVDEVEDVVEVEPDSVQAPSAVHPLANRLLGVCRLDDGLVFLFDVDAVVPADAVAGARRT